MNNDLRIVSLLPSATEIVCALGLERYLVGISHCCDYPTSVKNLPVLTESIIDPSLPSATIDRLTKEALGRGESLYRLNEALLRELRPTVVITQALCDVCAISFPSVARAVGNLGPGTELISLEPGCIQDIFSDIRRVAAQTSAEAQAEQLILEQETRLASLAQRLQGVERPRVLTLEWFEPAYFGGHWVPEQVTFGGGISVLGEPHKRSEGVHWETISAADPDVIVCMPCGYNTRQTRELLQKYETADYLRSLRAAQTGKLFCVDANAFFSRPSPRVAIGAELIAHVLHPSRVNRPAEADAPVQVRLS